MKIEQIYTGCLSQGAYYVESMGEAIVIDPLRDIQVYLDKAAADNAHIKYIFETHFHADFVSGHLDLASATGADIVFGPNAQPRYRARIANDGEAFRVGKLTVEVLHTPGHTLESVCYLLKDENQTARALFTGDTLFIGDVGRPDLAQGTGDTLTKEMLAGMLYDSLIAKVLPLPDEVLIYPAHGAGSACGKHMSKETFDTLGNQKRVNYALQPMNRGEFINTVLNGLQSPPAYFPQTVKMNVSGYEKVNKVIERAIKPLDPTVFELMRRTGEYFVLDTRSAGSFATGHIPGSINIALKGSFAPWVDQPLLIVVDTGTEAEVALRLARVGFDKSFGYLSGGVSAWIECGYPVETVDTVSAEDFISAYSEEEFAVLDVRTVTEYNVEHLPRAQSLPLASYRDFLTQLEEGERYCVYCAGGYRSMIFISLMKRAGLTATLTNVNGGLEALKKHNAYKMDIK